MARQINWDKIPDRMNLEAGIYRFRINAIKELPLDERNPYLVYLGAFEVEEPDEMKGEIHFERFRIGSEDDPLGENENTWNRSMGAKQLKKLIRAAGAPFLDTDEAMFEAARGCVFIGKIVKTPGKGANEGQDYSNMRGVFSLNSTEALKVGMPDSPQAAPSIYANGGAVSAGQKMVCSICSEPVSRADFGKHLSVHKAETLSPGK